MKKMFILAIVLFFCFGVSAGFAAEQVKQQGQTLLCPRSIAVDVTIRTSSAAGGWDAVPAHSRFTLAVKENVVRGNTMICHYTNGTVDYNLSRVFPKGRTCYIAPDQSFVCQ